MLTTQDLIARMTAFTLASLVCDLAEFGNQDAAERDTARVVRETLDANIGRGEAELLIAKIGKMAY